MKKQLVIIGIVVLLGTIGLSGCTNTSTDDNSVEFSNYQITTEWETIMSGKVVKEGFYPDYPTGDFPPTVYYIIAGSVRNIGDKPIDQITITAKYFDTQDNYLDSSSANVYTLYLNQTKGFNSPIFSFL